MRLPEDYAAIIACDKRLMQSLAEQYFGSPTKEGPNWTDAHDDALKGLLVLGVPHWDVIEIVKKARGTEAWELAHDSIEQYQEVKKQRDQKRQKEEEEKKAKEAAVDQLVSLDINPDMAWAFVKNAQGTTAEELANNALDDYVAYKNERKAARIMLSWEGWAGHEKYVFDLLQRTNKSGTESAIELARKAGQIHDRERKERQEREEREKQEREEREREQERRRCSRCGSHYAHWDPETGRYLCRDCARREAEEEQLHWHRMQQMHRARERPRGGPKIEGPLGWY